MAGVLTPSEMKPLQIKASVSCVKTYHASFTSQNADEVLQQIPVLIEDAASKGFGRAWFVELSSVYEGAQTMLTFKAHGVV